MFDRLKDFLFGVNVVSVEKAKAAFDIALDLADKDENGYLSVRELVTVMKEMIRNGE